MTAYKFGDVILVAFPFTDQSTSKKRPAAIISSTPYNQRRPDVVIMAITSQIHGSDYFGDIRIQKWQQAGLLKASVIKPILTTIEKGLIIKRLGCLADNDQEVLHKGLQTIIG